MVIKNIPLIVGSDADHVDLVDEATFASADTVSTISGHEVETDDTSLDNPAMQGGILFQDADIFNEGDLGLILHGFVLDDSADTFFGFDISPQGIQGSLAGNTIIDGNG